jgi:hypothetical protein
MLRAAQPLAGPAWAPCVNLLGALSRPILSGACAWGNTGAVAKGEINMIARVALFIASLLASVPAVAQSLSPEAARQLVTNKQFVFTCVDGSRGLGEIHDDGSVIGAFQVSGSGPVRSISLPPGTLKVKGHAVCASLRGLPFEPCFNLSRTGEQSFRGAVAGLDSIAHCEFVRH